MHLKGNIYFERGNVSQEISNIPRFFGDFSVKNLLPLKELKSFQLISQLDKIQVLTFPI